MSGRRAGVFARAGRRTNALLLWLLLGAFLTGWLAFAAGSPVPAVFAAGVHGLFGLGVLVLAPWKNAVVRRSRRIRPTGWLLLGLTVICLASGFVQLFAGYVVVLGLSPIQLHVGSVLVAVPVLVWHIVVHRRQRLRRTDLSRRTALRTGAGLLGTGAGVVLLTGAAQLTGGADRPPAATGSRSVDAGRPAGADPTAIPATIWLFDHVPVIDPNQHRVRLPGRSWTGAELAARMHPVTARLDCTSGWYADATWTGRSLADLLAESLGPQAAERLATAQTLVVRSVTGYARSFPITEADRLWLVVACQGETLSAQNGGPVRLVAPHRRGFWWVKWVGSVELSERPSWVQLPFPLH